jgi:hypothetical protein
MFLRKQAATKLILQEYHSFIYRQEIFPGCTKILAQTLQTQKGFRLAARTLSFFTRFIGQLR